VVSAPWPDDSAATDVPAILSRRQYASNNNLRYAYNGYNYSTARIAKGDFIRLKEISLSYDLPSRILKTTPLRSASVKLQATNLLQGTAHHLAVGADCHPAHVDQVTQAQQGRTEQVQHVDADERRGMRQGQ